RPARARVEGAPVLPARRPALRVRRVRTRGGVAASTVVLAEFGHQRPVAGGPDGDLPGFAAGDLDRLLAFPDGFVAVVVDALPVADPFDHEVGDSGTVVRQTPGV